MFFIVAKISNQPLSLKGKIRLLWKISKERLDSSKDK